MKNWLFSSFLVLACTACDQPRPATTTPPPPAKPTPPPAPKPLPPRPKPLPNPDSLTISEPCAVTYSPSLQRIDEMKQHIKAADSSDFYTPVDDILFYLSETENYLRQRNIKIVHTQGSQVRFLLANGTEQVVDLRKQPFAWGVLLFDGRHAPREVDTTSPEADVKAVFHR